MSVADQITRSGGSTQTVKNTMAMVLPVFTATIFLSAFLLFSVQPLFAKLVLPVLGGSPGVWSVAMVFFQSMLLAGYAYAHIITTRLPFRVAAAVHVLVLLSAFVFLPLALPSGWEQPPQSGQAFWLLGLFSVAVGLPFFAVAANSPLLQAWFARTGHEHAADPYFLYGASNIGSFASLILYIVAFEPATTLTTQTLAWTIGFALLTALIAASAILVLRQRVSAADNAVEPAKSTLSDRPLTAFDRLRWIALAFVPSGLLVAVTAHVSTDIAAAPFLWVIPLALFLLTFVLAFDRKPIFSTGTLSAIVLVLGLGCLALLNFPGYVQPWVSLPAHLSFFFFATLLAHTYLVELRPSASRLTEFYLWMSFGGVLGGAITTLVSPLIFNLVLEYPLLILASLLCRPAIYAPRDGVETAFYRQPQVVMICAAMVLLTGFQMVSSARSSLFIERSFFGVVRVYSDETGRFNVMSHGTTEHGAVHRQQTGDRPTPITYYHESGGMARALFAVQDRLQGKPATMAVAGLGAGSILCHRKPGERWVSFEIDKAVVDAAEDKSLFPYVSDCGKGDPIVIGDARLTLKDQPDHSMSYLLIDAFSSDSIPVHLLTEEAFALYRSKLTKDGLLTVHISNRYMELESVLAALAGRLGMVARRGYFRPPSGLASEKVLASHVVVLANKEADFGPEFQQAPWKPLKDTGTTPWTDNYSNVPAAIMRRFWK
ncbi:MAG: fused MFS/spermidine synthase [Pseudomonadota bacterium]